MLTYWLYKFYVFHVIKLTKNLKDFDGKDHIDA